MQGGTKETRQSDNAVAASSAQSGTQQSDVAASSADMQALYICGSLRKVVWHLVIVIGVGICRCAVQRVPNGRFGTWEGSQ